MENFKNYYKFPLEIDEYGGNVIVQPNKTGYMMAFDWIDNEYICEYPCGNHRGADLAKKIVNILNDTINDKLGFLWSKDPSGDPTVICMNGLPCIEMRGWGDLTSPNCYGLSAKEAASIQDEFRDWIINKLNN